MPKVIGEDLLARDELNRPRVRIATVFPETETIVTLPGTHATQRVAYVDALNRERAERGLTSLTNQQEEQEWLNGVDLVLDDDAILIRPDPRNMPLAFEADELLQQITSKKNIRFLHVLDQNVREAIKRRGECWRISPLPRSPEEMKQMIAASRIGIGGKELYYYNKASGIRLLTCDEFRGLTALPEREIRQHLAEIAEYSNRRNRLGNPEIGFFESNGAGLAEAFAKYCFSDLAPEALGVAYETLLRKFHDAVPASFRRDDPESPTWRSQMYASLIGQSDKSVSEESLLGLSAEFFMQVEWLPGGRIEDGELILDSVFNEEDGPQCVNRICDETARGFIFNFIRDFGDLEYVNVGRVSGSLSGRQSSDGRRGVYLVEVKLRDVAEPVLRILRMQKWGVAEHLDDGKDLLTAILNAEEYTEYILDRRLGCRQLGMNLCPRTTARKVFERYYGCNAAHHGTPIWSAYFERDYIGGSATDKIPTGRFAEDAFAMRFARLMGRAAAPNLILGRCTLGGQVVFDDGDELVLDDAQGLPDGITVADHTGTFVDYKRDLRESAPAYAATVNRRVALAPNPPAFAAAYLDAFAERFAQVQRDYRKRCRAFDTLFKHKRRDEGGSFAYRWERVLKRLDASDALQLRDCIRQNIALR
ncbi:MAG TPA: hypothetical protein VGI81_23165 [Tepidisphaeraceae bacterium]|jgi:hypothetical protein